MDLREKAEERASEYRSKLDSIDRTMSEEMSKVYRRRRNRLLQFLYIEKAAHLLTLAELEALLQGSSKAGGGEASASRRERSAGGGAPVEHVEMEAQKERRAYRIITWGGAGDALLVTPAIRKLKQLYPRRGIHVYCISKLHKEVLTNNKNIDRLLVMGPITRFILHLAAQFGLVKAHRVDYGRLAPGMFYRRNAAEIIGEMLGIEIDDQRPECSLTEEEEREARMIVAEYSNPVVIHATAECTGNKNWPAENWESLVLNNPQYTFLQLGSAKDNPLKGVVNMCGKTSIRQAIGIVKVAKAFVGVDSVFAHAAAAFRKPAVVLFGASTPAVWGHAGNTNLYDPPRCSPCIDVLGQDSCPYERTCMTNIAVSEVERALSSLLARTPERA